MFQVITYHGQHYVLPSPLQAVDIKIKLKSLPKTNVVLNSSASCHMVYKQFFNEFRFST
jgi:hypothetical protein